MDGTVHDILGSDAEGGVEDVRGTEEPGEGVQVTDASLRDLLDQFDDSDSGSEAREARKEETVETITVQPEDDALVAAVVVCQKEQVADCVGLELEKVPDAKSAKSSEFQAGQTAKALHHVQSQAAGGHLDLKAFQLLRLEPVLKRAIPASLTSLCLSGNAFADMENLSHQLAGLRSLTSLDLANCGLSTLPSLPRLQLERLDVSDNSLSSSTGVAKCSSLRWANFSKNKILMTDQIEMLLELRTLDLSQNRLASQQLALRPLAACTKLECLYLEGNPLARSKKHRAMISSLFPSVILLDGHALRPQRLPRKHAAPSPDNASGISALNMAPTMHSQARDRKEPKTQQAGVASEHSKGYARPTVCSKMARVQKAPDEPSKPPPAQPFRAQPSLSPWNGQARPTHTRSQQCIPAESAQSDSAVRKHRQPAKTILRNTESAAQATSITLQSQQTFLYRELIEEKRRLLQRVSAKLGEGVATARFSGPPPAPVSGQVREDSCPEASGQDDIRLLCERLREDIQRKRNLLRQTQQV